MPHAVDTVGLLRRHRSVDPERVFVLGHSMGGKVALAVAAAPTVAGPVITTGAAQPMHQAAVRVVSYLATVVPDQVPPAAIETFQRQATLGGSAETMPRRGVLLFPRGESDADGIVRCSGGSPGGVPGWCRLVGSGVAGV
ncbi:alpha/beta fold hydrolase [Streptomyces sp. NPDC058240]|uniref:alpha/beta fold hydrolase n=1 Tax=Streptomyces sp. NPDC058240 TaxID=3346396 RepID=UPI0036E89D9A